MGTAAERATPRILPCPVFRPRALYAEGMWSVRTLGFTCLLALARPAEAQQPSAPLTCPTDHTNRVVIEDPLPWLEALLRNPGIQAELRGGSLGDFLELANIERSPEPKQWLALLKQASHLIPVRTTLAFTPNEAATPSQMLRIALLCHLLSAVDGVDDEAAAARERPALQKELLQALDELAAVRVSLLLECRDERAAEDCIEACLEFAEGMAQQTDSLHVNHGPEGARVVFLPAKALDRDLVAAFLVEFGAIEDEDDPALDDCWRWLAARSLSIEMTQRGSRVRFLLATDVEAAPLQVAAPAMQAPAPSGAAPIASLVLDRRPELAATARLTETWGRWSKTEVGKAARQEDPEHLLADVAYVIATADRSVTARCASLGWSQQGLEWQERLDGGAAHDLRGDPIAALIPLGAAGFSLDAAGAPADLVMQQLFQVEMGLTRAAMSEGSRGDGSTFQELLDLYYQRVGPLHDLLAGPGMHLWRAPSAWLLPQAAEATFRLGTSSWTAPAPALLFVVTKATPEGGLPFARRLFTALANGPGTPNVATNLERDLGLGVPTVALPTALLGDGAESDPDATLHAFELADRLVFSTSARASKELLARVGKTPWVPMNGDAPLLGCRATTGIRLGLLAGQLGTLATQRLLAAETEKAAREATVLFTVAGSAIAGLLRQFGTIRETTRAIGGATVTEGVARFARSEEATDPAPLLARARERLGPWPAGAAALVAEGTCSYLDTENHFRFVFTEDGRFLNHIDGPSPEANCWDGKAGWGVCDEIVHPMGRMDQQHLGLMSLVMSGQWAAQGLATGLRCSVDTLPGEGPGFTWHLPDSAHVSGFWLDPDTLLPCGFDFDGACPPDESRYGSVAEFRAFHGRQLPHRIGIGDAVFRVDRWEVLAALDAAAWNCPQQPEAASFAGPPAAELRIAEANGMEVHVIRGEASAWLGIDLLGYRTELTMSAAKSLGIPGEVGHWTRAPSLTIGPMTLRNQLVFLVKDPSDKEKATRGGAIGYSLFARCCAELDVSATKLELYPPGHFADRQAPFTPLTQGARTVLVDVALDDETTMPFALGFGNAAPLNLNNLDSLHPDTLAKQHVRPVGAFGARYGLLTTQWRNPRIGAANLGNCPTLLPANRAAPSRGNFAGFFGRSLLEDGFRLLIDLPGNRIAFVKK